MTNLYKENKELKERLRIASEWMKREIEKDKKNIIKEKIKGQSINSRINNFNQDVDVIVNNSIRNFFGELIFLAIPEYVLKNIISAETLYYNQCHYKFTDGLGIITSYQKAVEFLIEKNITKQYRNYVKKHGPKALSKNDLIEKTLSSVVNKGYSLGVGRLYNLLINIKNNEALFPYAKAFKLFLEEYWYIKDVLLNNNFLYLLELLVNSKLFGEKRHKGIISFEETKYARKLLIGDLKDKNCIIYFLLEIGEISV